MGFASFVTFAALWATDVGIARAGNVFVLLAATVMTVRLLTARVVDGIGARATATIALSTSAAGLAVMAIWQVPAGAYLGTAVVAVGQGFMFPALFTLVILAAPESERGQAVGAFSISFDLAFGLGGILAGAVANSLGGIPAAFWFGAAACGLALIVARAILPATGGNPPPQAPIRRRRPTPIRARRAGSEDLDLDVHPGGQVDALQRVDRLRRGVHDVQQPLVNAHLEVLAAVLVLVG